MGSSLVATPDGKRWSVRRRLLAWHPRRRISFELSTIGLVIGAFGLVLLAVEWVAAVALTAGAIAARVLLRRPWTVHAVLDGTVERRLTWKVVGYQHAGALADRVRTELAAGEDPGTHADRRGLTTRA